MANNPNFDISAFAGSDDENCPVKKTLTLLQGKWNVFVLYELEKVESIRFTELKNKIGNITNNMLTSTLKELEQKGLVHREQFNEIPPRVEYSLTPSGKAMFPIFMAMGDWGKEHLD